MVSVCACSLRPAGRDACGFQLPLPGVGAAPLGPGRAWWEASWEARPALGSGGDWPSVPLRQDQDLRKEREWVSGGLWGRPLMQPRQGWPPCRRRRDALPGPRSQMEGGQAGEEPPAPASRRGVSRPQPRTQGSSQHHPFPWPPVLQAISRAATVWKHFLVFSNSVLLKKASFLLFRNMIESHRRQSRGLSGNTASSFLCAGPAARLRSGYQRRSNKS